MSKKELKKISEREKKKSRAKFQRPPALGLIIDLAASIPPNIVLPDWREVLAKHKKNNFPENYAEWQPEQRRKLKLFILQITYEECSQELPEELKPVILGQAIRNQINKFDFNLEEIDVETKESMLYLALVDAFKYYEKFRLVRAELRELVNFLTKYRERESPISYGEELSIPEELPKFEIKYSYDNGSESIKSQSFDLYGAVYEKNLNRLRACEICNHIFWAKRIDSKTCSHTCLNRFNVRNHRSAFEVKLKKLRSDFTAETAKLEKLKISLKPENKLIAEQVERVNKVQQKIKNMEATKNGTL